MDILKSSLRFYFLCLWYRLKVIREQVTQPEYEGVLTFVQGQYHEDWLHKSMSTGLSSRGALKGFLSQGSTESVCPDNALFAAITTSSGKAPNSQGRADLGDAGVCYSTHTPFPTSNPGG